MTITKNDYGNCLQDYKNLFEESDLIQLNRCNKNQMMMVMAIPKSEYSDYLQDRIKDWRSSITTGVN